MSVAVGRIAFGPAVRRLRVHPATRRAAAYTLVAVTLAGTGLRVREAFDRLDWAIRRAAELLPPERER